MFRKRKLEFPPRTSPGWEDRLKKEMQDWASAAVDSMEIYPTWSAVLKKRPFDIPFYTALNDRACIAIHFSAQAVPRTGAIRETLQRPWILHTSAFLQGGYPILRCNLVFPDNPQDPYFLETPLDVRNGDVQDFCRAALADPHIDIIIGHEQIGEGQYACAFRAPELPSILQKELQKVLKKLKPAATRADFNASVRKMEAVFSSSSDGIEPGKCAKLVFAGEAKNRDIPYSTEGERARRESNTDRSEKHPYPELEPYVGRLVDISKRVATSSGAGYLGAGREDCRAVGEEINSRWGFDAMVYVCERIRSELGAGAFRELEYAWDGIGRWRG